MAEGNVEENPAVNRERPADGEVDDRRPAVLVVGAGPAGLAAARALKARGLAYDQVERLDGVGGIWDIDAPGTPMYETAHFNSSKTQSGFHGFPMGEDLPDYPSHRQVLAYLRDFADAYGLTERIELGTSVEGLVKDDDGTWIVQLSGGRRRRYDGVLCCSGTQWVPSMPDLPGSFDGEVMHSLDYRNMDQLRGRRVLVLGGGNSACDIVVDASRVAERAVISMRRGYWFIPKHVLGVPVDVFAAKGPHLPARLQQAVFGTILKVLYGTPERWGLPKPDHRLFETHPVLNSHLYLALQHGDVTPKPGIARIDGSTVSFTDGTSEDFDLIIAATGFKHAVPYAQRYFGNEQHPELYLTGFSREHEGLFGVSFTETNTAAYGHFDALAQMIASHLWDKSHRPPRYAEFRRLIRSDYPDLSGGLRFDGSPRHRGYVDATALSRYRERIFRRMGWRMLAPPGARAATRSTGDRGRSAVRGGKKVSA
jgi:cation diffusion facilitator CzcD-associated flavoprotein CzcO